MIETKKAMKFVSAFLALTLIFSAATGLFLFAAAQDVPYPVWGYVNTSAGVPVASVEVNITDVTKVVSVNTTTDGTGLYTQDIGHDAISTSADGDEFTCSATYGVETGSCSFVLNRTTNVSQRCDIRLVSGVGIPDLVVEAIEPKCGYLFANETNNISATIKNNGTEAAGAFKVSFNIAGVVTKVSVSGLAVGAATTVYVVDTTLRNAGIEVTVTVTADCDGAITESNETNNVGVDTFTVYNNGYKNKSFMGLDSLELFEYDEVMYGGIEYNVSGAKNYPFDPAETDTRIHHIDIPAGMTVKKARLYVYWYDYWAAPAVVANLSVNFSGTTFTSPDAEYTDWKGFGSYNYPRGTYAYNITSLVTGTGDYTVILENIDPTNKTTLLGEMLFVVYEDPSQNTSNMIQLWILEGNDLLMAADDTHGSYNYGVSPEEATATVAFPGTINLATVGSATLVSVVAQGMATGSNMLYNGNVIKTDAWDSPTEAYSGSKINVESVDVTANLSSSGNTMGFRDNGTNGMQASNAFLVVTVVPVLTTIEVSPSAATLNISDTQEFNATAKDQYGNPMAGINITWTSSNTYVGTVNPGYAITGADGNASTTFTAVGEGTTPVTAENDSVLDTAIVTVLANGAITGKVTDSATGTSIQGATVTADGATTQTNIAGSYTISLKAGTYTVSANKTGYIPQTKANVVVTEGNPTTVNFPLVHDYVELGLKTGEKSPKRGYINQNVTFNLTVKNYGRASTYMVTNPPITNATVYKPSTTPEIPVGGSQCIEIAINATFVGAYEVRITTNNVTYGKSASTTIVANVVDPTKNVTIGVCNVTSDSTLENGSVVIDSNVTAGSTVGNGTIVENATVSGTTTSGDATITGSDVTDTTVTDSLVSEGSNVTGGKVESSTVTNTTTTGTAVEGSTVTGSTATGGKIESSTVTNTTTTGTAVEGSTVTSSTATGGKIEGSIVTDTTTADTTVEGSTLVDVNATGCTIEDVTLENIDLENATVTNVSGKATIKGDGAKVNTSGDGGVEVHFENIYEDIPVEDLVKNQTIPDVVPANTSVNTTAAEAKKVGASLSVNSSVGGNVTISKCGINPGGSTFALQGFSGSIEGDYLHISSDIPEGTSMTVKVCIYYGTEPGDDKKIAWYDEDNNKWVSLDTKKEQRADGWYLCTETNHLSIFAMVTTTAVTAAPAAAAPGGGVPVAPAINVPINPETGAITSTTTLTVAKATLTIPEGIIVKDAEGNPLATSITTLHTPSTAKTVGAITAYDFGPSGTTFSKPIDLVIAYDPAEIPAGFSEKDLVVKMYDGTKWIDIDTTVDTVAHTATAKVSHFSIFALFAAPPAVVTPTVVPTAKPTIPPVTPTPPVVPPVKRPWGLIIGIIIAVIVIGAAAYYFYTKKKA